MAKYKRKLAKYNKAWDKSRDEFGDDTGGFETIPSGNYVIGKLHVEMDEDANGLPRIKREQTVLEGDHEGFKITDRMNIDPSVAPRGIEFILKWFNLLGYQVNSFDEDCEDTLDAINGEMADATFQATIKEKDGFNNVFYNKVLEEGSGGEGKSGKGESSGEEPGDGARGEMPDIDAMSRRQLKKLARDEELDMDLDLDEAEEDDIRDAIETAWDKPAKATEEPEPEPEPESEKKPASRTSRRSASRRGKGGDDEAMRKGLYNLGDAFGIDVGEDDDLKKLKKTLGEYTWKKKELEDKEVKLLEDAGLGDIIK